MKFLFLNVLLINLILIWGCSPEPAPIKYGTDICEHCSMTISDPKWGAEAVTKKSKIYKFDSIECLAAYYNNAEKNNKNIEFHSLWTVNYLSSGELIDATTAYYLRSEELRSPMGLNIASFKTEIDRNNILSKTKGKFVTWNQIKEIVKSEW